MNRTLNRLIAALLSIWLPWFSGTGLAMAAAGDLHSRHAHSHGKGEAAAHAERLDSGLQPGAGVDSARGDCHHAVHHASHHAAGTASASPDGSAAGGEESCTPCHLCIVAQSAGLPLALAIPSLEARDSGHVPLAVRFTSPFLPAADRPPLRLA